MASLATPRTGLAGQPSTGPVCKPQRAGTGLMAQAWGNPFGPTDGSITGDFHPKSQGHGASPSSPSPAPGSRGCWTGPEAATPPLTIPRLPRDPTARDPGYPPLTRGLRTPRLLPLPQLACHQALRPHCRLPWDAPLPSALWLRHGSLPGAPLAIVPQAHSRGPPAWAAGMVVPHCIPHPCPW